MASFGAGVWPCVIKAERDNSTGKRNPVVAFWHYSHGINMLCKDR